MRAQRVFCQVFQPCLISPVSLRPRLNPAAARRQRIQNCELPAGVGRGN